LKILTEYTKFWLSTILPKFFTSGLTRGTPIFHPQERLQNNSQNDGVLARAEWQAARSHRLRKGRARGRKANRQSRRRKRLGILPSLAVTLRRIYILYHLYLHIVCRHKCIITVRIQTSNKLWFFFVLNSDVLWCT